jgi:hypothetical protein
MALRAGAQSAMTKFGEDLSSPCNYLIINVRAATWKRIHHVTARIRLEYQRTALKIFRGSGLPSLPEDAACCVEFGVIGVYATSQLQRQHFGVSPSPCRRCLPGLSA